ncbi:hypothetical protein [Algoriphagus sp.]|uniref:hypothetical protein n=1 Tax=Algoriphagus sp. TaxID=1872435 RepID=UPI00391DC720
MEIKLSESELQFLADKYGSSGPKFEFTASDQFTVFHPKATINCEIIGFTKRLIMIHYKLGFFKNLFFSWFVDLVIPGVSFNKKENVITIDPFHFLPEKERIATEDFSIQEFSVEPGLLLIRIDIMATQNSLNEYQPS